MSAIGSIILVNDSCIPRTALPSSSPSIADSVPMTSQLSPICPTRLPIELSRLLAILDVEDLRPLIAVLSDIISELLLLIEHTDLPFLCQSCEQKSSCVYLV